MTDGKTYTYEGTELDLFSQAWHWKAYWGDVVAKYVEGHVLDVGAGIGSTIRVLCNVGQKSWLALEPDANLAERLRQSQRDGRILRSCEVKTGRLSDLSPDRHFDTILYIDVLEHILDDRAEVTRAARHLAPGGHLVVLAPAHQRLSPRSMRLSATTDVMIASRY